MTSPSAQINDYRLTCQMPFDFLIRFNKINN